MLSASVTVDKQFISSIEKGILDFAAVAPGDTETDAEHLASKVLKMRLWDDDASSAGDRLGEIQDVLDVLWRIKTADQPVRKLLSPERSRLTARSRAAVLWRSARFCPGWR